MDDLKKLIREVPDYPKPGIMFRDISPLLRYHFSETNKSGNAGRQHVRESFRVVRRYGPAGLAWIFRFLYHAFDLKGCYDQPPTCSAIRSSAFVASLAALRALIGPERLFLYNWHFASCQERGVRWW